MNLRVFNGVKEVWDTYYTHFESTLMLNQWTDDQAAAYLRAALEGEAAECVTSCLGPHKKLTLKRMIRYLRRMFGVKENSDMHRLQLAQMQ